MDNFLNALLLGFGAWMVYALWYSGMEALAEQFGTESQKEFLNGWLHGTEVMVGFAGFVLLFYGTGAILIRLIPLH